MTTPIGPPGPDRHHPAKRARHADRYRGRRRRDRSELGSRDRRHRCRRLPHRPLPGRRLHRLLAPGQTSGPGTTLQRHASLAAGTSYSYQVRAVDAAGNLGPYSNAATRDDPSPPRRASSPRTVRRGRGHDRQRTRRATATRARSPSATWSTHGQVRQGARLQRHERARQDPGRGLAAAQHRHDARGLGQPGDDSSTGAT